MKSETMHNNHYRKLFVMAVLSFISMYILMYAMVNTLDNVFFNINQFYMAGLMTMPMVIIEIGLMHRMYMNKKRNAAIIIGCLMSSVFFFLFIQKQSAVSDEEFLKSMIPHHASAILMAKEAHIQDKDIKELAKNIIYSQQLEIYQMKAKLKELKK